MFVEPCFPEITEQIKFPPTLITPTTFGVFFCGFSVATIIYTDKCKHIEPAKLVNVYMDADLCVPSIVVLIAPSNHCVACKVISL